MIRGSFPYHWWIKRGPLPDRLLFHPFDARPRKLEDADALLRGRFNFNGYLIEIKEGSIFDKYPPSAEWAAGLHGFAWLPPLIFAGGDAAHRLARNLLLQWLRRQQSYSEPAWLPQIMAQRLLNILAHGQIAFDNKALRRKLLPSLRAQARYLAHVAQEAPDGLPRFEAVAVAALCTLCLPDTPERIEQALKALESEINRQLFADGGHISRSPEDLLHAYRHVTLVIDALMAARRAVPLTLRSAHDRMAPMIRFFRYGDGGLALFHGGGEGDARAISALLARDEVKGQPHAHAPHSNYQRMAAGPDAQHQTIVILDCGPPPPEQVSTSAHASALAFELVSGPQRIVVNCGAAPAHSNHADLLRATAAHSTLTLADLSSAFLVQPGLGRKLLGPRLLSGPDMVSTSRLQTRQGWSITALHDAYAPLGFHHERLLSLSPEGYALTGRDRLIPITEGRRGSLAYAIRFHIHPDVRLSASQGGGILLKLPNNEGWRFRASGRIDLEDSIYYGAGQHGSGQFGSGQIGGGKARKTEQIVLTGAVRDSELQMDWLFERMGT